MPEETKYMCPDCKADMTEKVKEAFKKDSVIVAGVTSKNSPAILCVELQCTNKHWNRFCKVG